jgi:hypothetical protein
MIQNILQSLHFTRIFKCFHPESSDSFDDNSADDVLQKSVMSSLGAHSADHFQDLLRSSPLHQSTCHQKWTSEILPFRRQPPLHIIMKSSSLFSQPQRNPISQLPSAVHRGLHSPITSLRDIFPFLLTPDANHGLREISLTLKIFECSTP